MAGAVVAGAAGVLAPEVASAAPRSLYASVGGTGTGCTAASPCTFTTAVGQAVGGDTILLATPGADHPYYGNWTISAAGTSASNPLTIEPAPGIERPILSANWAAAAQDGNPECTEQNCEGSILTVASGVSVTLRNFEITDGENEGPGVAGGVNVTGQGGTVVVSGMLFDYNSSLLGQGGAITNGYNAGGSGPTLVIKDSRFDYNTSFNGGAINNAAVGGNGVVTVNNSLFLNNSATYGGAIANSPEIGTGTATIVNSSFTSNLADQGGAISGGGGSSGGGGAVTVIHNTFVDNQASIAPDISNNPNDQGTANMTVAANITTSRGNDSPGSCYQGQRQLPRGHLGEWFDNGYNVGKDSSCFNGSPSNVADANLATKTGALQDNGGPTLSRLLLSGNPGIALIPNPNGGLCPISDQRGAQSPTGAKCNAGSVQTGTPPASVPDAPTSLSAAAGDTQVTLHWSPPASNGGSAITRYDVYKGVVRGSEIAVAPVACTASGAAASTCTVTGLSNGSAYFFKVVALNAVGISVFSNETSATPLLTPAVPGPPTGLSATPGNALVTLNWTPPSSSGTQPIVRYEVYKATTSGGETSTPPTACAATGPAATSCTATGLVNGQSYFFKVVAVNLVGNSVFSNEATATPVSPFHAADAPTGLAATAGDHQVALTWTPPTSDGGTTISGYSVYKSTTPNGEDPQSPPACSVSGAVAASCTATGLAIGVKYYFKVRASNDVGASAFSNEASATPVGVTPPGAPILGTATPGNRQVALSWTAPSSDGGGPISTYSVYAATVSNGQSLSDTPVCAVAATSCTVVNLTNDTTYFFKVVAANSAGTGPFSNQVSATPFVTLTPIRVNVSATQTYNGAATFTTTASVPSGVSLSGNVFCSTFDDGVRVGPTVTPASYILDPDSCNGLSLAGPNAPSYFIVYQGGSYVVSRATQTPLIFTTFPLSTVAVGDPGYTVSAAGGNSSKPITYSLDAASTGCSLSGADVSFIAAGTCRVDANRAGDNNYLPATRIQQRVTVVQAEQGLQFTSTPPVTATFGDPPYTVVATGGASSFPITYSLGAASTGCSLSGTTVSFTAGGECWIQADRAGDDNYLPARQIVQVIPVVKAQQANNLAFSPTTGTFGQTLQLVGSGGSGTGAYTFEVTFPGSAQCSITGSTLSVVHAGNCNVTMTHAADAGYLVATKTGPVHFDRADQPALSLSPTSGFVGVPLTLTPAGGDGTGLYFVSLAPNANCTLNGATLTASAAGTCSVTVTRGSGLDYNQATRTVAISFTIAAGSPQFTSADSTTFVLGPPGSFSVTASGTPTPTITQTANMPSWLHFSNNTLSGQPFLGTVGDIPLVFVAHNGAGLDATQNFTLHVTKANQLDDVTFSPTSGTFGTPMTLVGANGSGTGAYSFTLVASGSATCSLNGSTLTAAHAGTCDVSVTRAADANFNASTPVTRTVTFPKATQATTVTVSPTTGTVGTPLTLTAGGGSGTGGYTVAVSSGGTANCAYNGSTLSATSVGNCSVTATRAADGDYDQRSDVITITWVKGTQANSLGFSPTSGTLGQALSLVGSGGSGTGAYSFTVATAGSAVCSLNGAVLTSTHAGTCGITVTRAADANYNLAAKTATVTINKGDQAAVTVTPTSGIVGTPLTLTPGGGSGTGAYSVALLPNGNCSLNGATLTASAATTCLVMVTRAADGDYNQRNDTVPIAFTVAPVAPQFTSGNSVDFVVNAAGAFTPTATGSPTPTITQTAALPAWLTFANNTLSGTPPLGTVGNVTLSFTASNGVGSPVVLPFTLRVVKAAQAALTVNPASGTFGSPVTLSTSGGSGSGAVTFSTATPGCSITGVTLSDAAAGSCLVTAQKAADADYNASATSPAVTVSFAKANQAALSVTPTTATVGVALVLGTSGGTTNGTVTFTLVNAGTASCSLSGSTLSATAVGTCSVTVTMAGNGNYNDVFSAITVITINLATSAPGIVSSNNATFTIGTAGSFAVAATGAPTPAITETATLPAWLSFVGGTATLTGTPPAGSAADYTLAFKAANGIGTDATQSFTLHVVKATPAATLVVTPANGTFGSPVTLGATGGSGAGAVSFTTRNGTAAGCAVNGTTLTVTGAGTCLVIATRAGDDTYLPSNPSPEISVNFAKANQATLTLTSTTATVGTPLTLTTTGGTTSGAVSYAATTGSAGCVVSGSTVNATLVGSCDVVATMAGNNNYNAVSSPSTTITFNPQPPDGDSDGILDNVDNCPTIANANQANHDNDTLGDACDPDDDNDGVADVDDPFPWSPGPPPTIISGQPRRFVVGAGRDNPLPPRRHGDRLGHRRGRRNAGDAGLLRRRQPEFDGRQSRQAVRLDGHRRGAHRLHQWLRAFG